MANDIIKDRDNPVTISVSGVNLELFTDIKVNFGDDERSLNANPESIKVISATEIELYFNDTTETNSNYWEIIGYDAVKTKGHEITGPNVGIILRSNVVQPA